MLANNNQHRNNGFRKTGVPSAEMLYEEDEDEIGIDIERPKKRQNNNKVTFDVFGRPESITDQEHPWLISD